MLRTFQTHRIRPTRSLNGLWEFTLGHDGNASLPADYDRTLLVPCAWEKTPGLEAHRGQGYFRTRISGMEGLACRVVFGGVSHTADVYIDAEHVAHHHDAFTPFELLAAVDEGSHELVVRVDNTFGDHSALHIPNDYQTYGGITRPVEVQHVPPAFIERLRATPRRGRGGKWNLDVEIDLHNWTDEPLERELTVALGHDEHPMGTFEIPPGESITVEGLLESLDVRPWSADSPELYEVGVTLYEDDEAVDDLIDRVGFRAVTVKGRKLLLNNEPIRLRGYNRHEDHPAFGCAIPLEQMFNDLQVLHDLGCNFIRTSHYPNDQRFLDLCDELGFYVWEESHARNVKFSHPRFDEQIDQSTREMVLWHHNHPSIILWGCLNECESHTEPGRAVHRRVLEIIRELDDSRPVTFASNKHENDLCLDLVDIVSINTYTGWYGANIADVEHRLKRFLKWLHSDASGGKGKPVILSEFGAGAIPGYHDPSRVPWTEEYQADVLDEELRIYLNHSDVVGASVWQFCDIRISAEGDFWLRRPRTMNNKGTVDEFRRPKLAYEVVKRRMAEAKEKWGR